MAYQSVQRGTHVRQVEDVFNVFLRDTQRLPNALFCIYGLSDGTHMVNVQSLEYAEHKELMQLLRHAIREKSETFMLAVTHALALEGQMQMEAGNKRIYERTALAMQKMLEIPGHNHEQT